MGKLIAFFGSAWVLKNVLSSAKLLEKSKEALLQEQIENSMRESLEKIYPQSTLTKIIKPGLANVDVHLERNYFKQSKEVQMKGLKLDKLKPLLANLSSKKLPFSVQIRFQSNSDEPVVIPGDTKWYLQYVSFKYEPKKSWNANAMDVMEGADMITAQELQKELDSK